MVLQNDYLPIYQTVKEKILSSRCSGHNDEEKSVLLWGDSDILYLTQLSDPEIMKESLKNSVYHAKIGTKIT